MPPRSSAVYIGSYTRPHRFQPKACGEGIVVCDLDRETGTLHCRQTLDGILNPAYLALDHSREYLIAASENLDSEGMVCAFRRGADGRLTPSGTQASGGIATCHVYATPAGKICASSYLDGGVAIYPFREGSFGVAERQFRYAGRSVNPERQEASHAHQAVVSPDGRWLYVCDLGADRIWRHPITAGNIAPALPDSTRTPPGSGPRHLVFHPVLPRLYLLGELNAHLLTHLWDRTDGQLTLVDEQATLPPDWTRKPSAAAIKLHPSTKALYVSNRNHNSVAIFQLDENGGATMACRVPCGGETPRDIAVDPSGRWLLTANQESNNVAAHRLNENTGLPQGISPSITRILSPACILFLDQINEDVTREGESKS